MDYADELVRTCRSVFGDNLLFCFVGGSRAWEDPSRSLSDVDIFVVTRCCRPTQEREFAARFRDVHHIGNLRFDHVGEVFCVESLDSLLSFTEAFAKMTDSPEKLACYAGGCMASIFRKGQVVLNFLADPKICTVDEHLVLNSYVERALAYFSRTQFKRSFTHSSLNFSADLQRQKTVLASWQESLNHTDAWMDTPVGIHLDRWFGKETLQTRSSLLTSSEHQASGANLAQTCPLTDSNSNVAAQCLLHSA